jgi:hypothetical protein
MSENKPASNHPWRKDAPKINAAPKPEAKPEAKRKGKTDAKR